MTKGLLHQTVSPASFVSCLLIIEFYFKKRNFEDNFSSKIEASGWMKTNMAAMSYHPRILSPKYGQTGNVKLLPAKRSLSFTVKWPNLDFKVSSKYGCEHFSMFLSFIVESHKSSG